MSDAGGVGALLEIADISSGKTFFPCYNGNGDIAALVNASTGATAAVYEYSPFGEFLRSDTLDPVVADQPFRFSTKFFDGETGLYDYGRRFYSPSQGRFLGRDPIEEKGGLHLYGFCGNNAINRWDVLGMAPSGAPRDSGDTQNEVVVINGIVYNRVYHAVGSGNEGDELRWNDGDDEAVGTVAPNGDMNLGAGGSDTRGLPQNGDVSPSGGGEFPGWGGIVTGSPIQPPVVQVPTNRVTISIGFTYIIPDKSTGVPLTIGGATVYHTYVMLTDSEGRKWEARAGPSMQPSGGSNNYGQLRADSVVRWEIATDKPSDTVYQQLIGTRDISILDAIGRVENFNGPLNNARIPYRPTAMGGNFNSNSYTSAVLGLFGFSLPAGPDHWAPGFSGGAALTTRVLRRGIKNPRNPTSVAIGEAN